MLLKKAEAAMATREPMSVKEFVHLAISDVCQVPHVVCGSAEMLATLLEGLDWVRRFCDGTPPRKCYQGFNQDWEQKGFSDRSIFALTDERLRQQGVANPTEQQRMGMLIEIWCEVTGFELGETDEK
jgi:hypothetical protein